MEKYIEEVNCPICLEIPKNEIFQCRNGHIICDVCVASLTMCPQCRQTFEPNKIRNRVLENLLNKMTFDCKFKDEGCNVQLTRQELCTHSDGCEFGGSQVRLCRKLALSCDFVMSTKRLADFFAHFKQHKSAVSSNHATDFIIELVDELKLDGEDCILGPQFITPDIPSNVTYFSLGYFSRKKKTLSFLCFKINHDKNQELEEDIRAEFFIKSLDSSKKPDIVYNTTPYDVKYTGIPLISPQYPLTLLLDHYAVDKELNVNFSLVFNNSKEISTKSGGSAIKLLSHPCAPPRK